MSGRSDAPTAGIGPLSFQQADLVEAMHALPECADRYSMVCLFEIDGELDRACLVDAIDDVVRRHPMLRTTVEPDGAKLVQRVHATAPAAVVRGPLPDRDPDALLTRLLAERDDVEQVLSGRPLFAAEVLEHDERRTLLAVKMHHLIYDAWAVSTIWRDLSECYAARRERRAAHLQPLTRTYVDFAREQRAAWPAVASRALPFWRRAVAAVPKRIAWRSEADAPRASSTTAVVRSDLSEQALRGVRVTARGTRVPPFLVLLSATAIAIGRVSGERGMLLGTDTASRDSLWKQALVGMFVDTRLSPVTVGEDASLTPVVAAVREHWLAAEQHRDACCGQVLEALGEPELTRVDMCPEDPTTGLELSGATVRSVPVDVEIRHWRTLAVRWDPTVSGWAIQARYRPDRLSRDTALSVLDQASAVLAGAREAL